MNRKTFLQATLATTFLGVAACSGEDEGTPGDGDGDMGTGGTGTGGAGTGGTGTGGTGTGGTGTGGSGTGGSGTGGSGTGGAGTGGSGTGGSGTGGSGTGGSTGGSGTGGEAGDACSTVMTEWTDNHDAPDQHDYDEMEVSPADVAAGVEKVYSVQGESQHPHTLTVTAQNFADLAANGMVELTTSTDGDFPHDHTIILTCSA